MHLNGWPELDTAHEHSLSGVEGLDLALKKGVVATSDEQKPLTQMDVSGMRFHQQIVL